MFKSIFQRNTAKPMVNATDDDILWVYPKGTWIQLTTNPDVIGVINEIHIQNRQVWYNIFYFDKIENIHHTISVDETIFQVLTNKNKNLKKQGIGFKPKDDEN